MTEDATRLVEALAIHDRISLYLLDAVADEALSAPPPGRGRTVGEMFAHIHNVRVMWLKEAAASTAVLPAKLEKSASGRKDVLREALTASSEALRTAVAAALESGVRIKGFKPHTAGFVGYLIAHQAYHHGEIGIVANQVGHAFDKRTGFGMWEWGVR